MLTAPSRAAIEFTDWSAQLAAAVTNDVEPYPITIYAQTSAARIDALEVVAHGPAGWATTVRVDADDVDRARAGAGLIDLAGRIASTIVDEWRHRPALPIDPHITLGTD